MFREILPTGRQNLEIELTNRSNVRFFGRDYGVSRTGVEERLQGGDVIVDVVDFDDIDLRRDIDAAFISIKPRRSTPIQGWFGDRVFIETVTAGSGAWIGVNPRGDVVKYDFDSLRDNQGLICYGAGWVGSWIAGKHGLGLLEVCIPRFTVDTWTREASLGDEKVGDTIIPIAFQALYSNLMGLSDR